jgi:hypothetical protein
MTGVITHKELEEVRASADVPEVGVKAGDRGVVVEIFERPTPAVRVEYADAYGRTKALVTYAPNLTQVLDAAPES